MRHPLTLPRTLPATAALLLLGHGGLAAPPAAAQKPAVVAAGAIQIARPFNKAIVRESVPIKLREFPSGGYVSVSIDGKFITAQGVPRRQADPVYVWDTKAAYPTAGSDALRTYSDGTHAITIRVYDAQNKLVGSDSVSVQLANRINLSASQGIKLAYPWKAGLSLRYQRRTTLTAVPTDASQAASVQILQQSLLRFGRTVENVSGGVSLIRDAVISVDKAVRPKAFVSYVSTRGLAQSVGGGLHAKYRNVDSRGRILSELQAQNGANSVGFSIPVLPPRRVSAGAHWEAPVQMTLDWISPYPATVQATSTLEDFEWQDRYPTAKIRETYTGPAKFYPGPGSALPEIDTQDVKFERTVFFAYNAGRIVRTETTVSLSSTTPGLLNAPGGFPGGPPGGFPGGPPPGFGGYPGGPPPGYPGGPPPGFGGYPGGPPPGAFGGPPGGFPGDPFGGGPPPGFFSGGYPGGPNPNGGPPDEGGPPPDEAPVPPDEAPGGGNAGFRRGGGGFGGRQNGGFRGYPGGPPGGFPGGGYPGGPPPGAFGGQGGAEGSPIKLTYTEGTVLLT